MRNGVDPTAAAAAAVRRIARVYPSSAAGVVTLSVTGDYGKTALHQVKQLASQQPSQDLSRLYKGVVASSDYCVFPVTTLPDG